MNVKEWRALAGDFEHSVCDVTRVDRRNVVGTLLTKYGYSSGEGMALDAGCGIGSFVRRHAWRFERVIAVDYAKEVVERARRHCEAIPNVEIQCRNVVGMAAVAPRCFDLVISLNVLTTPSASWRARQWKATVGLLRPGARLLAAVPSLESASFVWHCTRKRSRSIDNNALRSGLIDRDGTVQKFYSLFELTATLERWGASLEEVVPLRYPWTLEGIEPPERAARLRPWDWLCVARAA